MKLNRAGGILAHPTSFPSKHGIGDLGEGARKFIDFLNEANQTLWQILPLNPTGYGDSPYQSGSTFAMNDLLICPNTEPICSLLDVPNDIHFNDRSVDFGEVIDYKHSLYRKAFENFTPDQAYISFCKKHKSWLEDFALFSAVKNHFMDERRNSVNSLEYINFRKKYLKPLGSETRVLDYFHGAVWNSWPAGLVERDKKVLKEYGDKLANEIEYVKFLQYVVFTQWAEVKKYANKNGVKIIGDLPIFVAYDSADLWVNLDLFQMNGYDPAAVAGVPPDYFSKTGQLWGNPLYDWDKHKESGYKWWIERLKMVFSLVDVVRIDHFRGFEAYWSIPFGAKNAIKGKWVKGPGIDFFETIEKKFGEAPIIAEDLGVITKEVTAMRKMFNFPGMKILQFGMEGMAESFDMPHNYEDSHTVAYTGTHDNDTTLGWYKSSDEKTCDYFRRYMNVSGEAPAADLIRLLYSSSAKWVVAPIQDVFGLDNEDRMNLPGTPSGNWRFRFTEDMLTDEAGFMLKYFSKLFGRNV